MCTYNKKSFTFQELTQIALGGTEFGSTQIAMLYSVINAALKKLGCENERVTFCGDNAVTLKKMLNKSFCGPPLCFEQENTETPVKLLEKLTTLENRIQNLTCQLNTHLNEVKFCLNSELCWTGCEVEEQTDETLNALFHNKWFLCHLKEKLSKPMSCRLRKIESNINKLTEQMEVFKEESLAACEKMKSVKKLQEDLGKMRKKIIDSRTDFDMSMIEIQGLLNYKVNNCDILPVKADIRQTLDKATRAVNKMVIEKTTPKAATFYAEIGKDGAPIIPRKPSMSLFSRKSGTDICDCDEESQEEQKPLPQRIKSMDLSEIYRRETSSRCTLFSL